MSNEEVKPEPLTQINDSPKVSGLKAEVARLTNEDLHRQKIFDRLVNTYHGKLNTILSVHTAEISEAVATSLGVLRDQVASHSALGINTVSDHFKDPVGGVPVAQLPPPGPQVTPDHVHVDDGGAVIVSIPENVSEPEPVQPVAVATESVQTP